jgi:hypothetical protein
VDCRHGSSVTVEQAAAFIRSDEMLLHHEKYSGIYIDSLIPGEQLAEGYVAETLGTAEPTDRPRDNLLELSLNEFPDFHPLIVLDSAGGLGWFEFQETLRIMYGRAFHLLLDDVHHIKHWRSKQHILKEPSEFRVIAQEGGWLLAECQILP